MSLSVLTARCTVVFSIGANCASPWNATSGAFNSFLFELSAPLPLLLGQVVLVLALPVAIGMWLRRRAPAVADRCGPALRRLSFLGIGLVFLLVIADDPRAFAIGLSTTVPLAVLFIASSAAVGWLTASLVTSDNRDRFTLAAEFGTRNIGVAIAIAVTILGRVGFARFATTYALIEIPIMLLGVWLFRRYRQASGLSAYETLVVDRRPRPNC
jgi:bile acid:Na+ symporter, BASS family